jgi:hypothetical protein
MKSGRAAGGRDAVAIVRRVPNPEPRNPILGSKLSKAKNRPPRPS